MSASAGVNDCLSLTGLKRSSVRRCFALNILWFVAKRQIDFCNLHWHISYYRNRYTIKMWLCEHKVESRQIYTDDHRIHGSHQCFTSSQWRHSKRHMIIAYCLIKTLRWPISATPVIFLQRAQCSRCKRCISYSNSVCPSVCSSVRPSVCLSVTRRYCVKTTDVARCTVQFAPLDSKMCLVL